MAVIEKNIFIDCPPADIFNFAAYSPERIPEWFAGIETVDVDPNYPEVGSQIRVTYKAAGITMHTTGTVVELVPGERYAAQYQGMASGLQTWIYTPHNGGTQITLHFDYEMSGGGLGKIADKLIVERTNTSNFEQSLQNLKALMES